MFFTFKQRLQYTNVHCVLPRRRKKMSIVSVAFSAETSSSQTQEEQSLGKACVDLVQDLWLRSNMFPKHCACHTPDFADRFQTQIHRDSWGAMGMYIKAWEDITSWVYSGDSPAAGRREVTFSSFLLALWCWSVRTAHFGIFTQLRFLWLCSLHKHLAFLTRRSPEAWMKETDTYASWLRPHTITEPTNWTISLFLRTCQLWPYVL